MNLAEELWQARANRHLLERQAFVEAINEALERAAQECESASEINRYYFARIIRALKD